MNEYSVFLAGEKKHVTSQSFCIADCPSGSGYDVDVGSCVLCPIGYHSEFDGEGNCILCPANTYNNEIGAKECMTCPYGTTSYIGATSCLPGYCYNVNLYNEYGDDGDGWVNNQLEFYDKDHTDVGDDIASFTMLGDDLYKVSKSVCLLIGHCYFGYNNGGEHWEEGMSWDMTLPGASDIIIEAKDEDKS